MSCRADHAHALQGLVEGRHRQHLIEGLREVADTDEVASGEGVSIGTGRDNCTSAADASMPARHVCSAVCAGMLYPELIVQGSWYNTTFLHSA